MDTAEISVRRLYDPRKTSFYVWTTLKNTSSALPDTLQGLTHSWTIPSGTSTLISTTISGLEERGHTSSACNRDCGELAMDEELALASTIRDSLKKQGIALANEEKIFFDS